LHSIRVFCSGRGAAAGQKMASGTLFVPVSTAVCELRPYLVVDLLIDLLYSVSKCCVVRMRRGPSGRFALTSAWGSLVVRYQTLCWAWGWSSVKGRRHVFVKGLVAGRRGSTSEIGPAACVVVSQPGGRQPWQSNGVRTRGHPAVGADIGEPCGVIMVVQSATCSGVWPGEGRGWGVGWAQWGHGERRVERTLWCNVMCVGVGDS